MATSPASGPGGGFNGGAITNPLTVDLTPSSTTDDLLWEEKNATLTLTGSDNTGGSELDLIGRNHYSVVLYLDDDIASRGSLFMKSDGIVQSHGGEYSLYPAGSGSVIAGLNQLGIVLAAHSAPADASIQPGECYLWFDQTDGVGNTKLMLKGKSADGTVKTASVLLA